MPDSTSPLTRDEISTAIAEKAWKDDAFHKEVLANPNQAYEKYIGQALPPGVTIKVVEDTPTTVHFVIPAKPAAANELSDSELEGVAGGVFAAGIPLLISVVSGIAAGVAKKKNW